MFQHLFLALVSYYSPAPKRKLCSSHAATSLYIKQDAPECMYLLVYLVLSHSQQGATDCSGKVTVNHARSVSFKINGNCTFTLGNGMVDAISVSRVFKPSAEFGSITVNEISYYEDITVLGHIEPFAVLPMWSTYSAKNVNLTGDVHISLPVDSLVSFGMAEDPALLLGGVIADAYDVREWVYGFPAWAMWLLHGLLAALVVALICREQNSLTHYEFMADKKELPVNFISKVIFWWILLSVFLDVGLWGIWAHVKIGSGGGVAYAIVTTLRCLGLFALFLLEDRKSTVPFPNNSKKNIQVCGFTVYLKIAYFTFAVALALSIYLAYVVLYMGKVDWVICIAVAICTTGTAILWPAFAFCLLICLLAIVLNLGAGLLAPICMYRWYTRVQKKQRTNSRANYSETFLMWQETVNKYNKISFLVHLVSASALGFLVANNPEWPVYATTSHSIWEPVNANNTGMSCGDVQCQIKVQYDNVGRIPLEALVCVFHAMAVIAHYCCLRWKKDYYKFLEKKMNPWRWLEYSFSASIMQVVLLVMFGYTDVWLLSMAAVLMSATQLFGHATEQYLHQTDLVKKAKNPKGIPGLREPLTCKKTCYQFLEKWQFFFAGTGTFIVPWATMYTGFYWSVANSNPGPPEWVKYLIWSLVVTFASFAFVMIYYLCNHEDKFISYKSERYYCIFSILSKTLLTWQLYFGIFMRAERDLLSS